MPRQKEYNRDQVLDAAMKVFWVKGFEGTSIQDLVQATGLNRFGMYQAFGSKQGLFLEALDRYQRMIATGFIAPLERAPERGLRTIREFFVNGLSLFNTPIGTNGCLMTNTAVDLPCRCPETQKRIDDGMRRMTGAFRACLVGAQKNGELRANANVDALAQFLMTLLQGLMVLRRTGGAREQAENAVRIALESLPLCSGPAALAATGKSDEAGATAPDSRS